MPDMYHHAWQIPPPSHAPPLCPHTLPPCLSHTLTMPCTPPWWHVPPPYLTHTPTIPYMDHHHAWYGPPPCLTYTHHHAWHVQPPSLTCTITMPVMYHHHAWHVYVGSGDHAWEVSSLLAGISPQPYCFPLGDPLNLSRFLYRSKGKLIVATSLKNMSVNLSHCLQILRKSGTAPLLLRDRRLTQCFCPTYYSNKESFHCVIGTRATGKLNYKVTSGFKARRRRGTHEVLLSFPAFFNFLFLSLIVLLCALRSFESLLLWLTPAVIGGCNPLRRGNDRVENYKIKMNICHVHSVSRKPTHPLLSRCSSLACTCSSELPSSCTQQILPPSLLFSLNPSKQ